MNADRDRVTAGFMLRSPAPRHSIPGKVIRESANGSLYILSKHCYYPSEQTGQMEEMNAEYNM